MATDDIGTLRDELPILFVNEQEPPWGDEWVVIPADDVESNMPGDLCDPNDGSDYWESWTGRGELDGNSDWRIPITDSGSPGAWRSPASFRWPGGVGQALPPDCFAFYLPFHKYYPTWWGVYLVAEGIRDLGSYLRWRSRRLIDVSSAFVAARHFLYRHESFHHQVECFATRLEMVHRQPLYCTTFDALFQGSFGTDQCMEEALANGYALRQTEVASKRHAQRTALAAALTDYVESSPPGYRRGIEFRHTKPFADARSDFAEENHNASFPRATPTTGRVWHATPYMFAGISRITSRVNYLVSRNSTLGKRLRLDARLLTWSDLRRKIRKWGAEFVAEGKRHEKWRGPAGTSQLGRHGAEEVGKGILNQITTDLFGMNYEKCLQQFG